EKGNRHVGGFLYDGPDADWVRIRDVELESEYDDDWYHRKVRALVKTDAKEYDVTGDVWSNIPLRNRRGGAMTRITEGMTRWQCGDIAGSGLSEYLDQIVDGKPVGV